MSRSPPVRRFLSVGSCVVVLCSLIALPSPAGADSVVGTGVSAGICGGPFTVEAHSGPSGEDPTGRVTCGSVAFVSGAVTCLDVQGNIARLNIRNDEPFSLEIGYRITDNGPSQDTVRAFLAEFNACGLSDFPYPAFDFVGDIVVTDTQPPTSKDQCKDGGWHQFGYRNQGQCVAFLNRSGRS